MNMNLTHLVILTLWHNLLAGIPLQSHHVKETLTHEQATCSFMPQTKTQMTKVQITFRLPETETQLTLQVA